MTCLKGVHPAESKIEIVIIDDPCDDLEDTPERRRKVREWYEMTFDENGKLRGH